MNKKQRGFRAFVIVGLLFLSTTSQDRAAAQVCKVPEDRATIQIAIDDPVCLNIKAAPGTYYEVVTIRRNLNLRSQSGGMATIAGQVVVLDPGVLAKLNDIRIDTTGPARKCFLDALVADGGAQVDVVNVEVVNDGGVGPCSFFQLLFADGFETGNVSRWSDFRPLSRN